MQAACGEYDSMYHTRLIILARHAGAHTGTMGRQLEGAVGAHAKQPPSTVLDLG